MVTIGVDAHKRVHQAVAPDAAGHVLGSWRGANTPEHWHEVLAWAATWPGPRQWGVEGAWNYGRGLAQCLVAQSETVYEINPNWTAQRRRRARTVGKSDRLDAHTAAKLVHEEAHTLPPVTAEDETAVLDLLVTEREAALTEATRLCNQLHQLLLQVDPTYTTQLPSLRSAAAVRAVATYAIASPSVLVQHRVAAIHRLAQRLQLVRDHAAALQHEICALAAQRYAPLTRLHGVQLLTAGALAGILGPGRRFRSEAQLAAYAGAAPLEASSAGLVRHCLNRGGNRRLNAILYRIALTQARGGRRRRPTWRGGKLRARRGGRRSARSSATWCGRFGDCGTSVCAGRQPRSQDTPHSTRTSDPNMKDERGSGGPSCARLPVLATALYPTPDREVNHGIPAFRGAGGCALNQRQRGVRNK